jgi:dTDP-4-dehydrorhamnose reductase
MWSVIKWKSKTSLNDHNLKCVQDKNTHGFSIKKIAQFIWMLILENRNKVWNTDALPSKLERSSCQKLTE